MSSEPTPAQAAAHFAARLSFETDPSDVHAALEAGENGFVLVDTRSHEAWEQGHARGAVHIPKPDMPVVVLTYPPETSFVVYCWGPGCNGATRAGLIISELGYSVKEMIGGFEYWAREGMPVDRVVSDAAGAKVTVDATRAPDPLTSPVSVPGHRIACDC
ncbi:sulfurtransferase [Demequina sp. TTPB684]|uniref:rhodanese-like domain-containing protein n=1 Tax=unclassified Demequina TaxID=2620311 RepID=UPI001CF451C2|nr:MULTISPECIES: rhodanese-like domain-containing protein [unclassified Demequina]MCB2413633.1 sulfurtransferase [Demequina sp. TTPB684]UPU88244.1 rhodanese-like domain-containing protein [Demequina sp. TMPB413]